MEACDRRWRHRTPTLIHLLSLSYPEVLSGSVLAKFLRILLPCAFNRAYDPDGNDGCTAFNEILIYYVGSFSQAKYSDGTGTIAIDGMHLPCH